MYCCSEVCHTWPEKSLLKQPAKRHCITYSSANKQVVPPVELWSTEASDPFTSSSLSSQLHITNSSRTSSCNGCIPSQRRLQHRVVIGLLSDFSAGKTAQAHPPSHTTCPPPRPSQQCDQLWYAVTPLQLWAGKQQGQKQYTGSWPILALIVLTWF